MDAEESRCGNVDDVEVDMNYLTVGNCLAATVQRIRFALVVAR